NGRWRGQWSVTFPASGGSAEVSGLLRVQVHYYEDGNVQLVSSKDIKRTIKVQVGKKLPCVSYNYVLAS
ncbi:F-actin-capping protein subunit alpha-2-like, partial [Elysia marginata]